MNKSTKKKLCRKLGIGVGLSAMIVTASPNIMNISAEAHRPREIRGIQNESENQKLNRKPGYAQRYRTFQRLNTQNVFELRNLLEKLKSTKLEQLIEMYQMDFVDNGPRLSREDLRSTFAIDLICQTGIGNRDWSEILKLTAIERRLFLDEISSQIDHYLVNDAMAYEFARDTVLRIKLREANQPLMNRNSATSEQNPIQKYIQRGVAFDSLDSKKKNTVMNILNYSGQSLIDDLIADVLVDVYRSKSQHEQNVMRLRLLIDFVNYADLTHLSWEDVSNLQNAGQYNTFMSALIYRVNNLLSNESIRKRYLGESSLAELVEKRTVNVPKTNSTPKPLPIAIPVAVPVPNHDNISIPKIPATRMPKHESHADLVPESESVIGKTYEAILSTYNLLPNSTRSVMDNYIELNRVDDNIIDNTVNIHDIFSTQKQDNRIREYFNRYRVVKTLAVYFDLYDPALSIESNWVVIASVLNHHEELFNMTDAFTAFVDSVDKNIEKNKGLRSIIEFKFAEIDNSNVKDSESVSHLHLIDINEFEPNIPVMKPTVEDVISLQESPDRILNESRNYDDENDRLYNYGNRYNEALALDDDKKESLAYFLENLIIPEVVDFASQYTVFESDMSPNYARILIDMISYGNFIDKSWHEIAVLQDLVEAGEIVKTTSERLASFIKDKDLVRDYIKNSFFDYTRRTASDVLDIKKIEDVNQNMNLNDTNSNTVTVTPNAVDEFVRYQALYSDAKALRGSTLNRVSTLLGLVESEAFVSLMTDLKTYGISLNNPNEIELNRKKILVDMISYGDLLPMSWSEFGSVRSGADDERLIQELSRAIELFINDKTKLDDYIVNSNLHLSRVSQIGDTKQQSFNKQTAPDSNNTEVTDSKTNILDDSKHQDNHDERVFTDLRENKAQDNKGNDVEPTTYLERFNVIFTLNTEQNKKFIDILRNNISDSLKKFVDAHASSGKPMNNPAMREKFQIRTFADMVSYLNPINETFLQLVRDLNDEAISDRVAEMKKAIEALLMNDEALEAYLNASNMNLTVFENQHSNVNEETEIKDESDNKTPEYDINPLVSEMIPANKIDTLPPKEKPRDETKDQDISVEGTKDKENPTRETNNHTIDLNRLDDESDVISSPSLRLTQDTYSDENLNDEKVNKSDDLDEITMGVYELERIIDQFTKQPEAKKQEILSYLEKVALPIKELEQSLLLSNDNIKDMRIFAIWGFLSNKDQGWDQILTILRQEDGSQIIVQANHKIVSVVKEHEVFKLALMKLFDNSKKVTSSKNARVVDSHRVNETERKNNQSRSRSKERIDPEANDVSKDENKSIKQGYVREAIIVGENDYSKLTDKQQSHMQLKIPVIAESKKTEKTAENANNKKQVEEGKKLKDKKNKETKKEQSKVKINDQKDTSSAQKNDEAKQTSNKFSPVVIGLTVGVISIIAFAVYAFIKMSA